MRPRMRLRLSIGREYEVHDCMTIEKHGVLGLMGLHGRDHDRMTQRCSR